MTQLMEKLAAQAHKSWSGWMSYLFSHGIFNPDGSFTIPAEKVQRWQRQLTTPYDELPESEKNSDRDEAQFVLNILREEGLL